MGFHFHFGSALTPLRRTVFWLHLGLGLLAGAVVLEMSVTGLLLAYERQILEWVERDQRKLDRAPLGTRLGVEALLAGARAARPDAKPQGLTTYADPARAVAISLGREGVLYLDPSTGALLGEGSKRTRGFFRGVTDWHRWLGASTGESRDRARAVTGTANLAFLVMVLSGLYLWWPRSRTPSAWRAVTWFASGLAGRARDFNRHNVAGAWCFAPLVLVVGSAVLLSQPWGDLLLLRGAPQPTRAGSGLVTEGLDPLWARAERQVRGWRSLSARLPSTAEAPVVITIDSGDGTRPDLRAQLALDRGTGAVKSFEPYSGQAMVRKLRGWARFVHTGEAGGLAGQTAAAVACGGTTLLVWTGVSLAWRRFREGGTL
jgi:uncharacterized iron-regulated membrane protein